MKVMISGLFLLLTINFSLAQSSIPTLTVDVEEQGKRVHQQLKITKLGVKAQILGAFAKTSLEMTFFNPNERVLAGRFSLSLPEGATVSGYALDINGTMREGVVVDKHRGRQVFEKIVRRRIDPGLMESTKGNNFRTRIFPIPSKGSRTIRIEYVSEISINRKGGVYSLPLDFPYPVKDFSMRMEVLKADKKPFIKMAGLKGIDFKPWQKCFVAEAEGKNVQLKGDLVIEIPLEKNRLHLVETAGDGVSYFCLIDNPQQSQKQLLSHPKKITVFWDNSGSRDKSKLKREKHILQSYLKAFDEDVTVRLITFNYQSEAEKTFLIRKGDCIQLMKWLDTVVYDGGTQIATISQACNDQADFYLLFSDGLSTFGKEDTVKFPKPLYVFSSANSADHGLLRKMAEESEGAYFNIPKYQDKEIIDAIGRAPFMFLGAEYEIGALEDVVPSKPKSINTSFVMAGKLIKDKVEITLNFGLNGVRTQQRKFLLEKKNSLKGELLRKLWAQKKVNALMMDKEKNKGEIIALGKKHSIVTPGTSLLVLENLAQYVEFRIPPPHDLPAMREKYLAEIARIKTREEKEELAKISYILNMWKERLKWWKREFKSIPGKERKDVVPPLKNLDFPVQTAALGGLEWLKNKQNRDGSWGKENPKIIPSLTALSLLAFMDQGETPTSRSCGKTVEKAIKYLHSLSVNSGEEGIIKGDEQLFSHPTATLALAEAYALTRIPPLQSSVKKSTEAIIANQNPDGTFSLGYKKEAPPNLYFSFVNYQALKAAFVSQDDVPEIKEAIEKSVKALNDKFAKGDGFSIDGLKAPTCEATAMGVLSLQCFGEGRSLKAKAGMKFLLDKAPELNLETIAGYTLFDVTNRQKAIFNWSNGWGQKWKTWKQKFQDILQNNKLADNSWAIPDKSKENEIFKGVDRKIYATSMALMASVVYYRYLPTFRITEDEEASDRVEEVEVPEMSIKENETPIKKSEMEQARKRLKDAKSSHLYNDYLMLRKLFGHNAWFFIEAATVFRSKGKNQEAIKVLSNLAELKLESASLLRKMAYKLVEYGELDKAIITLEKVKNMRPDEPQSFRDLALVYAERAEHGKTPKEDYKKAMELLHQVVMKKWDRFRGIEVIALTELNNIIPKARKAGVKAIPLEPDLQKELQMDLRVVLSWDADATDVDLWVTEPSGKKVYYDKPWSLAGGIITEDFTRGYGPEEYYIRKAKPGSYKIQANYFGSSSAEKLGPVTIKVDIFTNYGRANQQCKTVIKQLGKEKEVVNFGTADFLPKSLKME